MKPSSRTTPGQRLKQYESAELEIKRRMAGKGGKTAKQVAMELGWPWRVVARALQRMAAKGMAAQGEVTIHQKKFRKAVVPSYEVKSDFDYSGLPSWLRGAIERQEEK